jgi:tripartite-type tricarboxylate transporter receptor subunit TctC
MTMSRTISGWQSLLLLVAVACSAFCAGAQPLPDFAGRPIRIIVPSAPNGAGDVLARFLGEQLSAALSTPVVIENRPGASGLIGNDFVAHSVADGTTLLFATSATQLLSAHLISGLPYDPVRDFAPVVNVAYATSVIVVNAALPVRTIGDLIRYARAHKGQLNYASSGVGSANHVDTEVFAAIAGVDLVHVPYRGTAEGYRALLADEVQVMFGAITSALPYVRSGRLRALVVLADHRSTLLPDVPTLAQAGLSNVDVRKWLGLLAPTGTPPDVVDRLNRTLDGILHRGDVRDWLERNGFEVAGGSPQTFEITMRTDFVKWGETLRRLDIRPQ